MEEARMNNKLQKLKNINLGKQLCTKSNPAIKFMEMEILLYF